MRFVLDGFQFSEDNSSNEVRLVPALVENEGVIPMIGSNDGNDLLVIPFSGDTFEEISYLQDLYVSASNWSTLGLSLTIRSPSNNRYLFSPFILDVLIKELDEPMQAFRQTVEEWRERWRPQGGLSPSEQRGLLGELIVLQHLMDTHGTNALNHWDGPDGGLHDFNSNTSIIEVKTTSTQPARVRISDVNQLAPVHGRIFSLVVLEISIGEGGSLPQLIEEIRETLHGEKRALFEEKIASVGYNDEHAHNYFQCYEIDNIGFIEIDEDTPTFPVELLGQLPATVSNIRYTLEVHAMDLVEVKSQFWQDAFSVN